MKNGRNIRLDIIKAIGIICVVLGHTEIAPATAIVNLFHVGLFFVVSGIFFKEEYTDTAKGLGSVLLKRVKRLYIPFVLYNLFFLSIRNPLSAIGILPGGQTPLNVLLRNALGIITLTSGESLPGPDWFIRALFILEVLFAVTDYLIKKISGRYHYILRWILAGFCLGLGYYMSYNETMLVTNYFDIPLNLGTILSCWILFTAGMDGAKLLRKIKLPEFKIWTDVLVAAAGFALLLFLNQHGGTSFAENKYTNIPFMLASVAAGYLMSYGLAGLIERIGGFVVRFFKFTGSVTLEILMMHLTGFKIVTVIYVLLKNETRLGFVAYPILTLEIWYWYLLGGLAFSLIFAFLWGKFKDFCKSRLGKKRFIVFAAIAVFFAIVPQMMVPHILGFMGRHPDYHLVFDKDYYLEEYEDLRAYYGEDADYDEVLAHFVTSGMDEARTASPNFDPHFYRLNNADLDAAFGDNWRQYYEHFMLSGALEGRIGHANQEANIWEAGLEAAQNREGKLELTIHIKDGSEKNYYVLILPAYESDLNHAAILDEGIFADGVTCVYDMRNLNDKYVLATRINNVYTAQSPYAYLNNAGLYSTAMDHTFTPASKKGLQMGADMIEDVLELGTKTAFTNLIVSQIMTPTASGNTVIYNYKGRDYYFNKTKLEELDGYFSELTANKVAVTAGIINFYDPGLEELYYPDAIKNHTAAFYALNTSTKEGQEMTEAFISFISKRYDGSNPEYGLISSFTIGNEVNESGTYNYMGEHALEDYLTEYTRTFRILYNIIKTNIPAAKIYVPMEPWWGVGSDYLTYGGREFLTEFAKRMAEEGNIDWGLAYHAYSYPLSDPKVLNDNERTIDETGELTLENYHTTDEETSVTITMENIEVLVDFMHKPEMLEADGDVRSIILSEQGYTSNSNVYGRCEALQAASMVYAYYKTEMNPDIDAFIYFLQKDDENASLGNNYYQFGLQADENGALHKKLSYRVYQVMDGCNTFEDLAYIKEILGIDSWSDVLEEVDEEHFEAMKEIPDPAGSLTDLSEAVIDPIPEQASNGKEILPEIKVTLNGQTLISDVDYDVVYQNNIERGTATILVVGIGEYKGIAKSAFAIQ